MRIDAHQHYWKIVRGDYFWMGPHVASICRDYLPDDLGPLLVPHGFDGSVVVQAASTVAETEFLLGLGERNPSILGVVGWLDLERETFEASLAALSRNPKLVGLRPMLQDLEDDAWILRPRVLEALRRIADRGLALDFLVLTRHLPHVCRVLELVPHLRSVIDHAAKPDLRGKELGEWRKGLAEVASCPNLFCKLSGLVTEADPVKWRVSDLAPAIEHALAVFGEDRVVFGSDWPVCTLAASYERVVAALREVLGGRLTPSFDAKLFGDNAQRLYRLPQPASK
jgi:L-fuconolactonase